MATVRLDAIVFDAGTQIRTAINEQVVAEYAELMDEGVQFPPIVLFHDGSANYLADGFHRFLAAQRNEFRDIEADVHAGTKQDALWFALGANKANGQRLTESDKKHAVLMALQEWPDKSAQVIAEQLGCSHVYVSRIRSQVLGSQLLESKVVGKDGKLYPAVRGTNDATQQRRDMRREQIAALVKDGKSSRDIIKDLKIRPEDVAAVRREMGVGIDNSKAAIAQRRQRVRDMAEQGYSTRQIAASVGISENRVGDVARTEGIDIPADRAVGRTKRHDSNRIVAQIVADAENLIEGVGLVEFAALDRAQLEEWLTSLNASRDKFGAFIRRLNKEHQRGQAA